MGYRKDLALRWTSYRTICSLLAAEGFSRFTTRFRARCAILLLALALACLGVHSEAQDTKPDWKTQLANAMPLLGHRNWILVVDSAYPLQTAPGIEVIETNAHQLAVVRSVLDTIGSSKHVRPQIMLDAELPFVPEQDAPGVSNYREQIGKMLQGYEIQSQLHETILRNIDDAGRSFHVLVLKTSIAIPYSSVFIRLDCRYWSAEQEKRLRAKMKTARSSRN